MRREKAGAIACLLGTVLIMQTGLTASCSRKPEAAPEQVYAPPQEITADMPWYEGKTVNIEDGYDRGLFRDIFSSVLGVANNCIIGCVQGYLISDTEFSENYDVQDYRVYDIDGNHLYDFDPKEAAAEYLQDAGWMYVNSAYVEHGSFYIDVTADIDGEYKELLLLFDPASGQIVSSEETDTSSGYTYFTEKMDGWTVTAYEYSDPEDIYDTTCSLELISPEGDKLEYAISDLYPDLQIRSVFRALYAGDHKVLLETVDRSFQSHFNLIYDLSERTMTVLPEDNEYSWLDEQGIMFLTTTHYLDGIGNITASGEGIKVLDFEQRRFEMLIPYDNCDVNRSLASSAAILSMTDDRIILGTSPFQMYSDVNADGPATIVILQRAASNPHAGDHILTAATFEINLSYPTAEAIRLFNREDNGALILIDPGYSFLTVASEVSSGLGSGSGSFELQEKEAAMSKLTIDLMAGEGPDIILDAFEFRQLDRSGLLLDMTDVIPSSGLYDNIIDSSKIAGCLYQVPLSFALQGLLVNTEDIDPSVPGFTYETYPDYIYGPCNGTDPTRLSRLDFMSAGLQQAGDRIQENGTYDFGSSEFRDLAAFVNGQILPDEIEFDPMTAIPDTYRSNLGQSNYIELTSASEYLRQTQGRINDLTMYGFPSSAPSGSRITILQSAAVSSTTEYPDDCKEFVRLLTGEEFQQLYADYAGFPINPTALREALEPDVATFNAQVEEFSRYSPDEFRLEEGLPVCMVDADELFGLFDSLIRSASGITTTDAAVEMIVREEIQAYFAGQKTLDEVIGIIQDRADTYVDERG